MISFTIKGKNFHPRAVKWLADGYYHVAGEIKYVPATILDWYSLDKEITFHSPVSELGFYAGFLDAAGENIYEPYGMAGSGIYVLKNNGRYVLDFHYEVGIITLTEETEEEEFPVWVEGVAMLWPWSPLFGPPLPKGFFPPWPMWMSRWTEIPGYPKVPS